jgi:hypothetical protein
MKKNRHIMIDFVGLRSSACSMKYENCCLQENNKTDIHIINHLRMHISRKFCARLNLGSEESELFKVYCLD